MLGPERRGLGKLSLPALLRFPGKRPDEVKPHVVELRLPQSPKGRQRPRPVVHAAHGGKKRIVESLHPERYPVHPRRAKARGPVGIHGIGIRLHADLGIGVQRKTLRRAVQNAPELRRRNKARRAPAEKHRAHGRMPERGRAAAHVRNKGVRPQTKGVARPRGFGIKGAVAALATAERHMNIQQHHPRMKKSRPSVKPEARKAPNICRPPEKFRTPSSRSTSLRSPEYLPNTPDKA